MLWKYDISTAKLSKLLKCSGLVGPPDSRHDATDIDTGLPLDIYDIKEPGSNGLTWANENEDILIMCQHGWKRIVQFNVNDINTTTLSIDSNLVKFVADTYNGKSLNSPNDLVLSLDIDGKRMLYFTDPPFARQHNTDEKPFINMLKRMTQDVPAVYSVNINTALPSAGGSEEEEEPVVKRILVYPVPKDESKRHVPNGIGINKNNGDLAIVITDFNNPRVAIYKNSVLRRNHDENENDNSIVEPKKILYMEKTYEGMPMALVDGLSFNNEHNKLFVNGPGGIYIYETNNSPSSSAGNNNGDDNNDDEYKRLGFLRLDEMCSNNMSGGGWLWITCGGNRFMGLLRIPLATVANSKKEAKPEEQLSTDKEL